MAILSQAAAGRLEIPEGTMELYGGENLRLYSEATHRDRWFADLHLQIAGEKAAPSSPNELARIDSALRCATPPFDGLTDVVGWLGLSAPASKANTAITIRVNPPADLDLENCGLVDAQLSLEVIAHRSFDPKHLGLSIRSVPGNGLAARQQVANQIQWAEPEMELRRGKLRLKLMDADNVLVMLSIGRSTVRRQWLLDRAKARNNRLLAVQHFDRDLKMIRNAVLESNDSAKFENGCAALLFLLGFTPVVQLETDSPDIVLSTPAGRMAVVECTTRVADFSAKLGKLVDRRMSLSKMLTIGTTPSTIAAVLVCRMPKDQISVSDEELKRLKVILITSEDLNQAFDRARFPIDPDRILETALSEFQDVSFVK